MAEEDHAAAGSSEERRRWLAERQQYQQRLAVLEAQNAALTRQLDWFKRQLFGRKSERRLLQPDPRQLPLAGLLPPPSDPAEAPPRLTETVKAYQRRTRFSSLEESADERGVRFAPSVPVHVITVPNPEAAGLAPDAYEVIGEKVTYRLAQRPGAYVVLKYVRPVIKLKATEHVSCPCAPPAVLEKSLADVSLLAGLLVDKLRETVYEINRGTFTTWRSRLSRSQVTFAHRIVEKTLIFRGILKQECAIPFDDPLRIWFVE